MTFNPNIPQGNQTIASTTNGIQTNFSQSNTAFGVDHVAFNVLTNQGQHNKVTLIQQASDPTAVSTSPILYCKSTTSNTVNNDIYFRRASNDASTVVQLTTTKVNPTAASSGTSFLPGGIIIQWGTGTATSGGATINFANTFPNACWGVVLSPNAALLGATSLTATSFSGASVTSFTATCLGPVSINIFYIAIGN